MQGDVASEVRSVGQTTNAENENTLKDQAPSQTKTVTLNRRGGKGRAFTRRFTQPGKDPFELIKWEYHDTAITNDRGEVIFQQKKVEAPSFWSPMAAKVVASKYLHGQPGTTERETGIRTLISRVVQTIAGWGLKDGYFASEEDQRTFRDELSHILLHQYACFNSPVWFNVGVVPQPQCSACFIVSVDDTMEALLELQRVEGTLFKYGSGTGSNLSTIRSCKERLSGGGQPSGPVSFMRGFDAWAGIIKSGGKTRRAAKMQILNVDHPDISDFITCKSDEEKKAWALIEAGYDGSFAAPGGAYESIAFQNANLSVRVTDDFMRAVKNKGTFWTKTVVTGKPCEEVDAYKIMRLIAEGTHICGDPGLQFDTTINNWHTCPTTGRINASNPCSEYMHLDNSACNLSSLNLLKYLDEQGNFDVEAFRHTVDVMISAQDMLIDNSSYPTKAIERCARDYRQLGLGYANLGATLMTLGLPYDSDEGREWAAAITALMTGQAYLTSAQISGHNGPFNGYARNKKPMLKVIEKHREASRKLHSKAVPENLQKAAQGVWDEALALGKQNGIRNSQATVLAPTGTISFMMDCDTTGIEPDIALVKYKKLSDGGLLKMVNRSVERALQKLSYSAEQIKEIIAYIEKNDTIEGAPALKIEHLPVFDCAFKPAKGARSIYYTGHLKMMSAVQPFISGAISKTVNLPNEVTVDEIFDTYIQAWESGLKAVALYRDGSKRTQPLTTNLDKKSAGATPQPVRRRLPDERHSITHKFNVGGLEGYLTVGLYEDQTPGEIFLVVAKEGSTLSGMMDAFATAISISLQYGVPLGTLVKKFSHLRFEPSGFTSNKDIPMAKSIVDYVFRWLAQKFLTPRELDDLGMKNKNGADNAQTPDKDNAPQVAAFLASSNGKSNHKNGAMEAQKAGGDPSHHAQQVLMPLKDEKELAMSVFRNSEDAPPCTSCGSSMMVRQAGCYVCLNCGAQGGCG
jgi:ribonucleoside-diphosphate reductase alpha chain